MTTTLQTISIGDYLLVTHKVEFEQGWNGTWQSDMDKFIGHVFVARSDYNPEDTDAEWKQSRGIWLADNELIVCNHFPISSLQLVSNPNLS